MPTKTRVRIIDFVDTGHPALLRMWDKRQRGYQAMGYRIAQDDQLPLDDTVHAVTKRPVLNNNG